MISKLNTLFNFDFVLTSKVLDSLFTNRNATLVRKKCVVVPGFVNNGIITDKILPELIKDILANREINKFPKPV